MSESMQPVVLVTGLPGHGKTLYAVSQYLKGKPNAYGCGIKGSIFPELDPTKWWEAPSGSTIVVDEAWKWFAPTSPTKEPPEHYKRIPEIRHSGHTLVLVTQDPKDLDTRIRRRVGKHYHVVRVFGTERANIHEWNEVHEDIQIREDTEHAIWEYDKQAYQLYKSAELHKIKTEVPRRIKRIPIYFGIAAVLVFAGGYYVYKALLSPGEKVTQQINKTFQPGAPGTPSLPGALPPLHAKSTDEPQSAQAYAESFVPRIDGLPHTAPRYDKVTQAETPPFPAACILSFKRCQCYTQQATRLEVPFEICKQIATGGIFMDFDFNKGAMIGAAPKPDVTPTQDPHITQTLPNRGSSPIGKQYASLQ